MANDIYTLDVLVTGSSTVTLTDDGSGLDTIRVDGIYSEPISFTLAYSTNAGLPVSASAIYYTPLDAGFIGHTLVINGVIENATGSNGRDFIQGNVLGNRLYGDNLATGPGMNDTLWGGEGNDTIHGGAGDDEILGDNDNDRLSGGAGVDTISGGGGVDTIEGGAGADVLAGGATAGDTLSYAGSAAGVKVGLLFGDAAFGVGGDAQGDRITGFANITGSAHDDHLEDTTKGTIAFGQNDNVFSGGRGSDFLLMGGGNDSANGGQGDDTLGGEAGRDRLIGGAGSDFLRGGAGADRFVYKTQSDSKNSYSADFIVDFKHSQGDKIDLSAMDADLTTLGTNESFTFRTAIEGFSGNGAEVMCVKQGPGFKVLADSDGNGVADFVVLVNLTAGLVAADFIL